MEKWVDKSTNFHSLRMHSLYISSGSTRKVMETSFQPNSGVFVFAAEGKDFTSAVACGASRAGLFPWGRGASARADQSKNLHMQVMRASICLFRQDWEVVFFGAHQNNSERTHARKTENQLPKKYKIEIAT